MLENWISLWRRKKKLAPPYFRKKKPLKLRTKCKILNYKTDRRRWRNIFRMFFGGRIWPQKYRYPKQKLTNRFALVSLLYSSRSGDQNEETACRMERIFTRHPFPESAGKSNHWAANPLSNLIESWQVEQMALVVQSLLCRHEDRKTRLWPSALMGELRRTPCDASTWKTGKGAAVGLANQPVWLNQQGPDSLRALVSGVRCRTIEKNAWHWPLASLCKCIDECTPPTLSGKMARINIFQSRICK